MRKLTNREKLQLDEDLRIAKIKVLCRWGYNNEEIAKILSLPITEVNIYDKKYNLREELESEHSDSRGKQLL